MDDLRDLFRNLGEDDETEDRTIYRRNSPKGERIDQIVVERTSFRNAFPETTREFISQLPLQCGHHVDNRSNPFGGYCQSRSLSGKPCGKEYCSLCAVQCPRCGIFVGAGCCARSVDGMFHCRACKRALTSRRWLGSSVNFLLAPFLSESVPDD